MNKLIFSILFVLCLCIHTAGQDSIRSVETNLKFKGQLSSWAHFNPNNSYPLYLGARYIPQLNYDIGFQNSNLIDFEASTNIYGEASIHFFDSTDFRSDLNPYRVWGRYSNQQFEARIGLQKIDFGTAMMIRALRWFDQIDPRDPLQLTDGVWAGLGRYYFLNNVNIWLWGLYGNKNLKGNETIKTNSSIPEFGGRIQTPIPLGEAGFSYHHRIADSRNTDSILQIPSYDKIPENRIGVDAKWDLIVGVWFEGAWLNKSKDLGSLTNQEIVTLGTDYTFGLGSGLHIVLEHMLLAADEKAFEFANTNNFSGLSLNYPIGMFDNLQAIFYYNWNENEVYNFINWYRQFDKTTLYLMGYWNPKTASLPSAGGPENLYGGTGIQIMFVLNH